MRVLVTGASSMIGDFLLPLLVHTGHEVVATSRSAHAAQKGIQWLQVDLLSDVWLGAVGHIDVWINCASLSLLPSLLPAAVTKLKVKRLIAFSSTSKFTKNSARGSHDRNLAQGLDESEKKLRSHCSLYQLEWVVFRPTLIYCLGRDKNITLIADKIRRFRFFPLVGSGGGLRQPVHAQDLAIACVQAISSENVANKAYNLSGGEVLSYRAMVGRLFDLQEIAPRFIHIPLVLLRLLIHLLRLLPQYRYLTPDMADRMERDMVFPHDDATRDFGYAPRSFQP